MELRAHFRRPTRQKFAGGRRNFQALRVVAAKMMKVEDQRNARPLVERENISGAVGNVVVFQNQAAAGRLGKSLVSLHPTIHGSRLVPVNSASVYDDHAFRPCSHHIQDGCLALDIEDALTVQFRVGAVEDRVLRRMERQTQTDFRGSPPESVQFGLCFTQLVVKLRHVRVRRIRRDVRGHPVHRDALLRQVVEDDIQVLAGFAEMRVLLPAPGVAAFQARLAHHLHGKTQTRQRQGGMFVVHDGGSRSSCGVSAWRAPMRAGLGDLHIVAEPNLAREIVPDRDRQRAAARLIVSLTVGLIAGTLRAVLAEEIEQVGAFAATATEMHPSGPESGINAHDDEFRQARAPDLRDEGMHLARGMDADRRHGTREARRGFFSFGVGNVDLVAGFLQSGAPLRFSRRDLFGTLRGNEQRQCFGRVARGRPSGSIQQGCSLAQHARAVLLFRWRRPC